MHNKLEYNGVVTLVQRVNNRVVNKRYFNNGTPHLFEAYARAMCGQDIDDFIPSILDVGCKVGSGDEATYTSKVKDGVSIPVLATYKAADTDGGNYHVPYCRISVNMLPNMFSDIDSNDKLEVHLLSSARGILASVEVGDLASAITDTSSGVQLILLWDLYVSNSVKNGDANNGGDVK